MDSTQQYSPAYLAEDKSREFLNVVIAFAILETVFMILFFTSRAMNKTSNGWDVYLMIPGYIYCFGHIVVASLMLRYGGAGRHMAALDRAVATRWIKLDVTEEFIYNFSILLPKLAVLCIYKRVFSTKPYRYAIYILGAIVILNCAVGQVVSLTICRPFAYIWNKSISDGHCGNIAATYRYITIPNLLTDVGVLVVPLHGVWHLHIKVVHKIALSLKFLIGCIGTITRTMRLVFFCQIDMLANVTWNAPGTMSWTLVETGVYLIAATLPSLRPLTLFFLKGFELKTPYHKLLGRCSRVFSAHKHLEGSTSAGNGARLAGFVKMKDVKPLDQKATHEEWV